MYSAADIITTSNHRAISVLPELISAGIDFSIMNDRMVITIRCNNSGS